MKSYSSIIFILVAIGIFFTIIDPQYKEVQALRETKQENDVLLERAKDLRRKRQELTDKYNAISTADRERLNKVLPETVDNVRLILDIDNIARRSGITVRNISISGDINEENREDRVIDRTGRNYGTIGLSFSFSTSYSTMKRFMSELEDSLRIVDITDFSVSAPEEGDVYSYTVSLDTYWLR
jgi:hypothetical protein